MADVRKRSLLDTLLLVIAVLAALKFWVMLPVHPFPGSPLLKAVPATMLALYAARHRAHVSRVLPLALLAHASGDVLLDIDRTGLFLWGLRAFLVGHLLYIAIFWPRRRGWGAMPVGRRLVAGLVAAYGIAMLGSLWPRLTGDLRLAVPVYVVAISCMCLLAVAGPWRFNGVALGALLFVLSDSLIAVDRFLVDLPWAMAAIWPTYVAAQLLITTGLVGEAAPPQSRLSSSPARRSSSLRAHFFL